MRFFDPTDELLITQRKLPHWSQEGVVVFITWRTQDSMPKPILEAWIEAWIEERNGWLAARGIDPSKPGWKPSVQTLPPREMLEYHTHFTSRWHDELDIGHGACVLRQPEMAQLVADSLRHFDGDKYEILNFVVMPNHVHLLATFCDKAAMVAQCESWKHYTATQINRRLGVRGRFWQQDAFDHLVRHETQFQRLKRYIAQNAVKARLHTGEYIYYTKQKSPLPK